MFSVLVKSFLRQMIFWYLFFAFERLIFLLYHISEITKAGLFLILKSFWFGIPLDTSAFCYLIIFPLIISLVQSIYNHRVFGTINKVYTLFVVLLLSIITSVELGLYDEWKTKLNYKALTYLEHPSEVVRTASWGLTFVTILFIIIQFLIGFFFYNKYVFQRTLNGKRNYLSSLLFLIISAPLIVLGIRGGTQQIPINQSYCYYSSYNILNVAAVNSGWNVMHSIIQNKKFMDHNPYVEFNEKDAETIVKGIYQVEKDTTVLVLKTRTPNVVYILLEGFSADLSKSLGGFDLTPNFDSLTNEGILFTNMYSSGDRSEQGMASILSGFPAQPATSILKQTSKFSKLPCISRSFASMNYFTSYLFGGQLEYGNIKAYLVFNGFNRILDIDNYPSSIPRGKLGVHDEYIFKRYIEEQNKTKEPFFSCVFTLSSHGPYDQPMKNIYYWGGNENGYINAAHYTDSCLGNYFREAKKQAWYDNTLFVIVADHSHNSPKNWDFNIPAYKRIPFLLYGNVLKDEFKGKKMNRISSQVDISTTILAQLGLDHIEFEWSKDLFNPYTSEFAYYPFPDGFGWVSKDGWIVYDYLQKKVSASSNPSSVKTKEYELNGKAFLQVLFQKYLDY